MPAIVPVVVIRRRAVAGAWVAEGGRADDFARCLQADAAITAAERWIDRLSS